VCVGQVAAEAGLVARCQDLEREVKVLRVESQDLKRENHELRRENAELKEAVRKLMSQQ